MGWQHELSRKIYLYAQKMNNDSISINARSKRTGPLTTALRNYMKSRMKFFVGENISEGFQFHV